MRCVVSAGGSLRGGEELRSTRSSERGSDAHIRVSSAVDLYRETQTDEMSQGRIVVRGAVAGAGALVECKGRPSLHQRVLQPAFGLCRHRRAVAGLAPRKLAARGPSKSASVRDTSRSSSSVPSSEMNAESATPERP